jgi:SSS family solute:Na+ symporter
MKLIVPFVIVIPGIIAFNLYSQEMRLDARGDRTESLVRYLAANPETQYVATAVAPTDDQIAAWEGERYLLAIYPDASAVQALTARNPQVLPLTQAQFDDFTTGTDPLTLFVTEDHSWTAVNPGLSGEMEAFNERVRTAAAAAGKVPSVQKMIAFKYDTALAQLLGHVLPQGIGLVGFVLAALLGAVVSSLAAMLNAASTIFAMDVFKKFFAPNAQQKTVVGVGRVSVVVFAVVAVLLAPQLGDPAISNSIFTIIQEGQGFISPGILAVFAFGLVFRRAPAVCGTVGLLTNIVAYGLLKAFVPEIQFLNRMALCFGLCIAIMAVITVARPMAEPIVLRHNTTIALESSRGAKIGGVLVVLITLLFYFLFSSAGLAG